MLTCKQVSALASETFERNLTWRERVGMRVHLMMCRLCSRYFRQLRVLHGAARNVNKAMLDEHAARGLSDQARERIRKRLG